MTPRLPAIPAVLIVLAGLSLASPPVATAQHAPVVAAAASLGPALSEIARAFEHERGTRVELVFGASGTLTRQILDGAPFEVFLSADDEFPRRLAAAGLTADAGVVYAVGRLAIFAPRGSPLVVDSRLEGLATLARTSRLTRFAIANPEVAPYGRAAEAVLRKHGLWEILRARLVLGDSMAQAAQFATTGNAFGGLIAASLAMSPELRARGTFALVPASDHPPLVQRMVRLARAGPVARAFYVYLQGPTARVIFERHGLTAPI